MLLLEQHSPQLFLLRIPHPHFIPIIRSPPSRCIRLPHRLHLHANFFSQPLQVQQRQHPFHFHLINLFQLRPVVEHFRRQVAVVRQEHQPRRRILQIPHGKHALGQSPQTIAQRLAPFRVRHRRPPFRRLLQHNLPAASCRSFAASAFVPSCRTTCPFTRTCPLVINSSACRREAIPARAIIFCSLSSMVSFLRSSLVGHDTSCPSFGWTCGCFSLHPYLFTSSSHSPAAVAFCVSPLSPSGIPSLFAAVSSSNSSRASIAARSVGAAFASRLPGARPAMLASSVNAFSAGANPSSLPNASRASASNSFKLGNSSRSLSPNRIKNSFDVLYKIGRPITSLRPAVVIKCLSSSVLITPEVFTPRISEISGEVTGCL